MVIAAAASQANKIPDEYMKYLAIGGTVIAAMLQAHKTSTSNPDGTSAQAPWEPGKNK